MKIKDMNLKQLRDAQYDIQEEISSSNLYDPKFSHFAVYLDYMQRCEKLAISINLEIMRKEPKEIEKR